jgi:hypothetical protein
LVGVFAGRSRELEAPRAYDISPLGGAALRTATWCYTTQPGSLHFMSRTITVTIKGEVDDDRYADLANAIWLVAYNTGLELTVTPDQEADPTQLNEAWGRYGDVSW